MPHMHSVVQVQYTKPCCSTINLTCPDHLAGLLMHVLQDTAQLNFTDCSCVDTGTLPASWSSNGAFPLLTTLALANMFLSGTLPASWGSPTAFQQLQTLQVVNTSITGEFPPTWQHPSAFPALQYLQLAVNQLTGSLPAALPAQLMSLDLRINALVGLLPPAWAQQGALPSLQGLDVVNNQLTGHLLSSWPSSLQVLFLDNNFFTGPLPSSGWPPQLQNLTAMNNSLTSSIPTAFSRLLPQLQWLQLDYNQLTGTFPAEWPSDIRMLSVPSNQLVGTLPSNLTSLQHIQCLGLGPNSLTGMWHVGASASFYAPLCLPSGIATAHHLQLATSDLLVCPFYVNKDNFSSNSSNAFFEKSNAVSGSLPPSWGDPGAFSELLFIQCENTSMTGSLPGSWGSPTAFKSLISLYLDGIDFTGTLPDSWAAAGAFPQLDVLGLWNTTLSGTLPESWTSQTAFPQLQVLDLSHNRLQGPLPAFNNTNLGVLNLHNNNLSSDLSAFWNSTAPLVAASLASNSISGILPDLSTALNQLVFLDVSSNQMAGTVPFSWLLPNSFLSHVAYFNLGNVWQHSVEQSEWRQDLCLKPDLYNPDILAKQLQALPGLQGSSEQGNDATVAAFNDLGGPLWSNLLLTSNVYSTQWLAAKLQGLDNPFTGQSVTYNQLTSVKDICANEGSKTVVLIVWVLFVACCLAMVSAYFIARCCLARQQGPGLISRLISSMSHSLHRWKAVAAVYPPLKGLVGLAFYYYDLVTSIIVLVQLWDKWPGHILVAIFFLHFATTGVIVTIRAMGMFHAKLFCTLPRSVYQRSAMVLVCILCCPVSILIVVLLDTMALADHVFACVKFLAGLLHAHVGCLVGTQVTCCAVPQPIAHVMDTLNWVDLDDYETMHNLVAAILQSLPTVVLNSVLYSSGNKPSHGLFLSDTLFITSIVASCLAMLKCLACMLWEAHVRSVSPLAHVFHISSGKTLQAVSP